jgi:magnesium-dependent phosphatase 1
VASRTCTPDLAEQMLRLLKLPPSNDSELGGKQALAAFDYLEMYPGSKTNHFRKLQRSSGVEFQEMLFFDDESRNRNVEELGVVMQLVRSGVSVREVDAGVERWRERNRAWLEKRKEEEAKGREG